MEPLQLDLALKYSLRDPDLTDEDKVLYREVGGSRLYRVFLYLDGPGIPFVESVTYVLHETFPNREIRVSRTPTNARCKLAIWTWGTFEARAIVRDKRGGQVTLATYLGWDTELPPQQQLERVSGP